MDLRHLLSAQQRLKDQVDVDPYNHMATHIMKTTLELPDDLLIEVKALAARRRTTLKEMVTRSLRREIGQSETPPLAPDSPFEIGALGLPVIKSSGSKLTAEDYQNLIDRQEQDEDRKHLETAR